MLTKNLLDQNPTTTGRVARFVRRLMHKEGEVEYSFCVQFQKSYDVIVKVSSKKPSCGLSSNGSRKKPNFSASFGGGSTGEGASTLMPGVAPTAVQHGDGCHPHRDGGVHRVDVQ